MPYEVEDYVLSKLSSSLEIIYRGAIQVHSDEDLNSYQSYIAGVPSPNMALVDESLQAYRELCELLSRIPWVQEFISQSFVRTQLNWLFLNKFGEFSSGRLQATEAINILLERFRSAIEEKKVLVPVQGLLLRIHELAIGDVTFKVLHADDPLFEKARRITSSDKKFTEGLVDPLANRVVAIATVQGEGEKAFEKVLQTIDERLNVVRYLSTYYPDGRIAEIGLGAGISGNLWNSLAFGRDEQRLELFTAPFVPLTIGFEITGKSLEEFQEKGLQQVNEILLRPHRTEFEQMILSALNWFGLARKLSAPMNFVAYHTGIEMLLAEKGDPEWSRPIGEKLAEAVAYLLGSNVHDRQTIKLRQKDLWRTRGMIVHGGSGWKVDYENRLAMIELALRNLINRLLKRCGEFHSKKDLIEWIENQRLSGGAEKK